MSEDCNFNAKLLQYFQYSLCSLVYPSGENFYSAGIKDIFVFILLSISRSNVTGLEFCFHGWVSKIQHRLPITALITSQLRSGKCVSTMNFPPFPSLPGGKKSHLDDRWPRIQLMSLSRWSSGVWFDYFISFLLETCSFKTDFETKSAAGNSIKSNFLWWKFVWLPSWHS